MAARTSKLEALLDLLERLHGKPKIELPRDALGLVLWENVAYLVDDERRGSAFQMLKRKIGLDREEDPRREPGCLARDRLDGRHALRRSAQSACATSPSSCATSSKATSSARSHLRRIKRARR
jgi:hypothetical protein